MSFVNFIEFKNNKEDALSIRTSPVIQFHTYTGIQLLPNNPLPYTQTTNVTGGIELEDWTVYVVDLCTGEETEVTDHFLVDRVFQDTKGQAQFDWKITNIPNDFGRNLVYLKAQQAIGETFYTNAFQITDYESEKTCRLDYSGSETMQSIQLQMFYWQQLKSLEIGSYYETSTRNTVTTTVKSQRHQRWVTPFISNNLMIKISDVFENKLVYVDLVRAYLFESPEIQEFQAEEDSKENIIKLSFNEDDIYDPSYVEPVTILIPEIILENISINSNAALYSFSYNNFNPSFLTFQMSQDQVNWINENNGVSSPQSISFNGTGVWFFRIIHTDAQSNIIELDLGSDIEAIDDTVFIIRGGSIDIDVLFNDVLVGDTIITEVGNTNNGTVEIIENGSRIRYTHNDTLSSTDSFTYTISNGVSTDIGMVSVNINSNYKSVGFLYEGTVTKEESCMLVYEFQEELYHTGKRRIPDIGDVMYLDASLVTIFNGGNKWYQILGARSIRINNLGQVIDKYTC